MRKKQKLLLAAAVVLILAGLGLLAWQFLPSLNQQRPTVTLPAPEPAQTPVVQKPENPIDFAALTAQNGDVFAYIKVPGTKVDYPVVQHKTDDDFYLKHRSEDGAYSASGAIYIQSMNTTSLYDPVTVIYGHNGYWDTMFTTLHKFEDAAFFKEHDVFYLWTPTRQLTYKIFSAFKFDDRHLLNSYNLADASALASFQDMLQHPASTLKQTREVSLSADSKIVILSTCITGQEENRYLVCGVLTDDQETA